MIIPIAQKVIFWLAIAIAISILLGNLVFPDYMPTWYDDYLWKFNSFALFALMIVRPLSDLFKSQIWLRRLVPMRKEVGILSAMIVLSFGLSKYIGWGWETFLDRYFSARYWPFPEPAFWGNLGELVAIPLLLTSNIYSMKLLGKNWKRIQRLTYLYFFCGAYFVYASFGTMYELWFMIIVAVLTIAAFVKKRWKKII